MLNSSIAYKLMQLVKNGDSRMVEDLTNTKSLGDVGLKLVQDVSMRDVYTIIQVGQAFYQSVLPVAKNISKFRHKSRNFVAADATLIEIIDSEVKHKKKVAAPKVLKAPSSKAAKAKISKPSNCM